MSEMFKGSSFEKNGKTKAWRWKHYLEASKNSNEKIVAKDKEHLKSLIEAATELYGDNCDLNFIDISNVTDMSEIFEESDFNGDISKWDVSNVTNMSKMFYKSKFNGDISHWNVSKVQNMNLMFCKSKFTQDISYWNVQKVNNIAGMFAESKLEDYGLIPSWFYEKSKSLYPET